MIVTRVMPSQQVVEDSDVAVIAETQVANFTSFLLFNQPVEQSVIHKPSIEFLNGVFTSTHRVQEQVVDVINL